MPALGKHVQTITFKIYWAPANLSYSSIGFDELGIHQIQKALTNKFKSQFHFHLNNFLAIDIAFQDFAVQGIFPSR